MRTIQLSGSMLYALASMLAKTVISMSNARRLAVVSPPNFAVRSYQYRDWRDLQATLRSLDADTRREVLGNLRKEIRNQRQAACRVADFSQWLRLVRATDAANGHTTTYKPHQPGLFLKPVNAAKENLAQAAPVEHPPEDNPTSLPSPSPRALRLASSLSKPTLRMIVGFRPLPTHVLASRCSTILNSRGETEPLAAQDLQAAARLQWRQSGHKPDLPALTPAPAECPGSPAGTLVDQARSRAPALRPTAESSHQSSSAQPSDAAEPATAN